MISRKQVGIFSPLCCIKGFKPYRKRDMNFYDALTPKLMNLTFMKVGFNAH